jgi:uncharacterized protein YcgL (UPF0745 family)
LRSNLTKCGPTVRASTSAGLARLEAFVDGRVHVAHRQTPDGAVTLTDPPDNRPPHTPPSPAMPCFVYASLRKVDSYLWLARRDAFDVLPESLVLLLGKLRFVMEVQLDESRRLPIEETALVLDHLRQQGWHLQLPPPETLAAANHLVYNRSPADERAD